MAIEKMTYVDITGHADHLDDVLIRCLETEIFQPENASKLSEYSIGSATLLRNPYGALLVTINEVAASLELPLGYREFGDLHVPDQARDDFLQEADEYLSALRRQCPEYYNKKNSISEELETYDTALDILAHAKTDDINFDELWQNRYLAVRFGRMHTANLQKLRAFEDAPFEIYKFDQTRGYTWLLFVTPKEDQEEVFEIFRKVGFERLRIPDCVHGTAGEALAEIQHHVQQAKDKLQKASDELEEFVRSIHDPFMMLYSKVRFLHDAYNLRRYAVIIRDQFHVVGFIPTRQKQQFLDALQDVPDITVAQSPAGGNSRLEVPVRLRNNRFVRPFEMFVQMYGSPSYTDIDPTPFVAYTYSLLFGMMFGDLGQGLVVSLVGLVLWKLKNMQLGQIMMRIGVVSAAFGVAYGSVFGFEHLLDPLFHAMGFHEKPIEVMHPSTTNTILIASVGIGVVIIITVILFNIFIGVKHRDVERVVFSQNGIAGLVFYLSAIAAAVCVLVLGINLLSLPYILLCFALPLLLIFFKEPLTRFIRMYSKGAMISADEELRDSFTFQGVDILDIFGSQYLKSRFGRIPTDSYKKLGFYENEPFMLYPIKTDRDYIWCLYAAAFTHMEEIDAIFQDLYFERIYIPDESLVSNEAAEEFIKKCVEGGGSLPEATGQETPVIQQPKTVVQTLFPDGFGTFFIETFFEMFEVLLSFITNTVSFLRIGGFILVHAGMMSVVFAVSEMVGGGAGPAVIILGNLFVMCMEGLIVGIQVLRLQFYEIFSRFFDGAGSKFTPAQVTYSVAPRA